MRDYSTRCSLHFSPCYRAILRASQQIFLRGTRRDETLSRLVSSRLVSFVARAFIHHSPSRPLTTANRPPTRRRRPRSVHSPPFSSTAPHTSSIVTNRAACSEGETGVVVLAARLDAFVLLRGVKLREDERWDGEEDEAEELVVEAEDEAGAVAVEALVNLEEEGVCERGGERERRAAGEERARRADGEKKQDRSIDRPTDRSISRAGRRTERSEARGVGRADRARTTASAGSACAARETTAAERTALVGACAFATVALETTAERGREEEEEREREERVSGGPAPCRFEDRSSTIDRAGKRTSLARLDLAGQGLCGTKEEGGNARQLGSPRRKRRARATAIRATATINQSRWLRSFATATTSTTRAKIARFEMPGAGTHWRRAPWTWRGTCKPFLRCEVCECSFERVRDYADRRARRPRFGCGLAASGQ